MAASSLPEMTNWHKCSRLLIEGGLSILKEFLKNSYSPGSLDQFLASKKTELTDLRNKRILNASQWVKLFPHSDIESLDITLICIILNLLIPRNSSQRTALDGIRDLRNALFAHVCHLSMDTVEFVKNWKLIDSALKKAQLEFGTNIQLKDLIDTVEKEEVVNGDEWRKALENWKRNDDILQEIEQTLKKHSSKISDLKGKVKEHSLGISEIKCEVKEHTSGISELKGEVKEHSSGFSEIKGEVKKHSSGISELKGEVKEHSSEMSELKGEVKEHSSGMSELKCEVKEHSSEISELKGEVKEHSSGMSELKDEVKEHSSEMSELKCEVKEHRSKISNIEGVVNDMKATRREIQSIQSEDLSELQICLVKHYTEHYMKSSIAATASSGCETDIDDIYVEPELKLAGHKVLMPTSDNKMSISFRDILPQNKNKCYNIYITGQAGMGKTSLCQSIVSSWCKACRADEPNGDLEMALKQYDILFYISLRHASDQHDIKDMIVSQLLKCITSNNEILSRFKPESLLQKLFEQASRTCLIILDGLDEWTAQGRSNMPFISDGVPERDLNLKYTLMTTTRPWKLEELRLKDSEMDLQIEINGVKSIPSFGEKLISALNKEFNMKRTYDDFDKCFSEAGLIDMQTIPILFKYLICLWFNRQDFGKSKTEVYTNIIDLCFENAEKREGVKDLRQHRHISTDTPIMTPGVFKGKEKCNKYMDILKAVGKLAFETAMDQKGMQLAFNSTDDLTDDQIQICLTVGILTQSIVPSIVCKEKSISFLHKTFHEYFTALYMGWLSSIPEEKFRLTKTNIYEREAFFIFLNGIWPSVSEKLLEFFLADTYDKDIMWDPEDIVKARLQTVVMRCCIESLNQNEHCPRVELRVITFNIDDCKSLLSPCNSLLRSRLNIERLNPATFGGSFLSRDFFNILSQISQKKILHTKGENNVLDLSELCGLKHLFLSDLDLDSLLLSPTLFTLKLDGIQIDTFDGMMALLSNIAKAESLNYLFCKNVRCKNTVNLIEQQESVTSIKSTDQGRNIYCTGHTSKQYFLHMDLSNPTRLRTIKLENMSISELIVSPVIETLTLKDIKIEKHDEIVSLMKSVSSLETLTHIDMNNIHCTEHASNKECFLNINLSRLTRLQWIILDKMSISELTVSPVTEYLHLEDIKIAKHDGIISLMKSLSSLETLEKISVNNIHCTEHASNKECFMNINLSKLSRLCVIILDKMSISELTVSPVIKNLTLKDIKIAKHDGIVSLMKCTSSLETLDKISLNNIHCTEHASNEECFLNIDLSKLTRLEKIPLENISISELTVSPVIKNLTLKDIKIATHDVIVSLMKSVSSLETLTEINMNNIHCTGHASIEECFLNIDFTKPTRLRCIILDKMSVSELTVSRVIETLTLKDVKIAKHDRIVSLMKSVSSLETLSQINMNNIHCTEHASNEECFLTIDFTKPTRLRLIILDNMSISELTVSPFIKDFALTNIKIAKNDGIVSLMKSVSSLETLTYICMDNIHCTEHRSNKECFLTIDLSKLTRLQWIILDNMSISELTVSPVTEYLYLEDIKIAKHDGIVSLIKSGPSVSHGRCLLYWTTIHCTEHASDNCFQI